MGNKEPTPRIIARLLYLDPESTKLILGEERAMSALLDTGDIWSSCMPSITVMLMGTVCRLSCSRRAVTVTYSRITISGSTIIPAPEDAAFSLASATCQETPESTTSSHCVGLCFIMSAPLQIVGNAPTTHCAPASEPHQSRHRKIHDQTPACKEPSFRRATY